MLVAGKNFNNYTENEQDFYITTRVKEIETTPRSKLAMFFISLLAAFTLSVMKILPLFIGLLIVIGITSFIRMVKFSEMKRAIDLNLFFILVLALAIGKAIYNSGVATLFAENLIQIFNSNPLGVLIAIYIITNIKDNKWKNT